MHVIGVESNQAVELFRRIGGMVVADESLRVEAGCVTERKGRDRIRGAGNGQNQKNVSRKKIS